VRFGVPGDASAPVDNLPWPGASVTTTPTTTGNAWTAFTHMIGADEPLHAQDVEPGLQTSLGFVTPEITMSMEQTGVDQYLQKLAAEDRPTFRALTRSVLRASNKIPEEGPQEVEPRAAAIRQAAHVPGGSQYNESIARQALNTPGPYNRPFLPKSAVHEPTVKPPSATPEEWGDYTRRQVDEGKWPPGTEKWAEPAKPAAAPDFPPNEWFPDPDKPWLKQHTIRRILQKNGWSLAEAQKLSPDRLRTVVSENWTPEQAARRWKRVADIEARAQTEKLRQAGWDRMRGHFDFVDRLRNLTTALDTQRSPPKSVK
jgi:hypothetical protein